MRVWTCAALGVAILVAAQPHAHAAQSTATSSSGYALHGEDALIHAYDAILEARFDRMGAELHRACGPAPPEACDVLAATAVWWRILLNPDSRLLDDEFSAAVERAIRTTVAWTERAPDSPEAWFYMGAAHALRVQWRVLRNAKLAAARDGKRIKQALERAVELEPALDDAYFGIGLYRYYADVAPAALKVLRFLLLLPGGDREEGLAQMLHARDHGRLLQGEADYQLHLVYLWYEQDPDRALALLRGLQREYPTNPLFPISIAEIQDTYQHDITASLGSWRRLLEMALDRRVNSADIAESRARLGMSKQLEALHETDRAIEHLEALVASRPTTPYAAYALAELRLGQAHDRLGARAAAVAAYRRAAAAAPHNDPYDIADRARRVMRRAPDAGVTEAYRLSLQGWRHLAANDLDGAAASLERSLALRPDDPVSRFRYGRVLQARGDTAGALAEFELAIDNAGDGSGCPAPILAATYLEAARLYERDGDRERALANYRMAATLFGAADDTQAAATRAIRRLER
jgi:tetratricopeptide (TPR) repeat protein